MFDNQNIVTRSGLCGQRMGARDSGGTNLVVGIVMLKARRPVGCHSWCWWLSKVWWGWSWLVWIYFSLFYFSTFVSTPCLSFNVWRWSKSPVGRWHQLRRLSCSGSILAYFVAHWLGCLGVIEHRPPRYSRQIPNSSITKRCRRIRSLEKSVLS